MMDVHTFHDILVPLPHGWTVVSDTGTQLVIEGSPPDNEFEKSRHVKVTFHAAQYTARAGTMAGRAVMRVRNNVNISEKRIMEVWQGHNKPYAWRPAGTGGVRDTADTLRRLLKVSSTLEGWA